MSLRDRSSRKARPVPQFRKGEVLTADALNMIVERINRRRVDQAYDSRNSGIKFKVINGTGDLIPQYSLIGIKPKADETDDFFLKGHIVCEVTKEDDAIWTVTNGRNAISNSQWFDPIFLNEPQPIVSSEDCTAMESVERDDYSAKPAAESTSLLCVTSSVSNVCWVMSLGDGVSGLISGVGGDCCNDCCELHLFDYILSDGTKTLFRRNVVLEGDWLIPSDDEKGTIGLLIGEYETEIDTVTEDRYTRDVAADLRAYDETGADVTGTVSPTGTLTVWRTDNGEWRDLQLDVNGSFP